MIAWAAIDLRDGHAVQLVGGRPEDERVRLADPVRVALDWIETGFRALHVIDLDAALASGDNQAVIRAIIEAAGEVPVQAGGGIRDDAAADALIAGGAARIIVGTRAVEDRPWLVALAARYPARVVVAADVRDGRIVTRGWRAESGLDGRAFVRSLDDVPLAGVLVTDVSREGRMGGVDVERFRALVGSTRHPLLAAGGIATEQDLRDLDACGAAGAVLGMSLYTGAVDGAAVAMEFQS